MRRFGTTFPTACVLGLAILTLASTSVATAQTTSYLNRAQFEAHAKDLTNITFEENGPGGYTDHGDTATFSGVTFLALDSLWTVDPDFAPGFLDLGSGDVLVASGDLEEELIISLPGGITAFGMDIRGFGDGSFGFSLSNGGGLYIPVGFPLEFVGFTSETPIGGVHIYGPAGSFGFMMDNFEYGTAVPEGSSFVMLLGGLLVPIAGVLVRRRWQNAG